MKKVIVIGCPGSGKTTFSRKLAKKTGLPLIHLDFYYHQKKYNYYEDKEAWRKKVRELAASKEWIIDGNYSSTFPERFAAADAVLWFDLPRRVVLYRLFKRRLQYHRSLRPDMPSDWREALSWEFFTFVWQFNKKYRHKITDVLADKPNVKLVRFTSQQDADRFLRGIAPRGE